jgi:hypothetical protein
MQKRLEQFFKIVSEFRRTRSATMLEGLRNLRTLSIPPRVAARIDEVLSGG